MPRFFSLRCFSTFQRINVKVGPPRLLLVDKPVLGQRLARGQLQPLTRFAADGNLRITGQVLPHVEHPYGILADGVPYAEAFHDLDGFGQLLAQYAMRGLLDDGGMPFFFPLQPRIVVLAAIDAVEGNGRQRPLPRMVTHDIFRTTVLIDDMQTEEKRGRTEGYLHLRIALPLLVVEAVAQKNL